MKMQCGLLFSCQTENGSQTGENLPMLEIQATGTNAGGTAEGSQPETSTVLFSRDARPAELLQHLAGAALDFQLRQISSSLKLTFPLMFFLVCYATAWYENTDAEDWESLREV